MNRYFKSYALISRHLSIFSNGIVIGRASDLKSLFWPKSWRQAVAPDQAMHVIAIVPLKALDLKSIATWSNDFSSPLATAMQTKHFRLVTHSMPVYVSQASVVSDCILYDIARISTFDGKHMIYSFRSPIQRECRTSARWFWQTFHDVTTIISPNKCVYYMALKQHSALQGKACACADIVWCLRPIFPPKHIQGVRFDILNIHMFTHLSE